MNTSGSTTRTRLKKRVPTHFGKKIPGCSREYLRLVGGYRVHVRHPGTRLTDGYTRVTGGYPGTQESIFHQVRPMKFAANLPPRIMLRALL